MIIRNSRVLRLFLVALAVSLGQVAFLANTSAANEIVVLRSGNASVGLADPLINMNVGFGATPLSPNPFTSADFDSACAGPSAIVVQPHPAWLPQLACDPQAQWIGIDLFATPASAMYCYNFDVQTCCIDHATMSFCWVSDDNVGDAPGFGPNPDGVYLNGVAVSPSIFGGNYATETQAPLADVTSLLHCGNNRLEVYNRDLGYVVSGVMFSATIEVVDCNVPTESSSWGMIKSLYR